MTMSAEFHGTKRHVVWRMPPTASLNSLCSNAVTRMGKWNSPFKVAIREGIKIHVNFFPDDHKRFAGMISTAYPVY
jgi:hypothetical protein